jgi:hypothetical protein
MNNSANVGRRRLRDRLRGGGGLMLGLLIGAAAFGASTAGAGGGDLKDPGGQQRIPPEIGEECAEGCDDEEISEYVWGEGLSEYILEQVFEAPPPPPDRVAANTP